jgi:hypothetical protein
VVRQVGGQSGNQGDGTRGQQGVDGIVGFTFGNSAHIESHDVLLGCSFAIPAVPLWIAQAAFLDDLGQGFVHFFPANRLYGLKRLFSFFLNGQ